MASSIVQKEKPTNNDHSLPGALMRTQIDKAIRHIKDGDWYWIHKAVIQDYAKEVGAVGVTVYNLLASSVDSNQRCYPSQKYIAACLGCSRATVNRALQVLEDEGLILVERRSRYHCVYRLLKVRCNVGETQMSTKRASDVSQMDTNNNKLTRIINNKDGDYKKCDSSFKPETREELLAYDIATTFNDFENLPRYVSLAKHYPESFLRRMLTEAKEIPDSKIKKSRSAIFNYFLNKYVHQNNHNPGN